MFLKIVIGRMSLWQKTAGCEEHNLPGRNFLHLLHEFYPIRLGQVFNDIETDAGIELSGAKMAGELTHIGICGKMKNTIATGHGLGQCGEIKVVALNQREFLVRLG
jgi:hypothetical protein